MPKGRKVNTLELTKQVTKYAEGMKRILLSYNAAYQPFEIIILVGPPLIDWKNEDTRENSRQSLQIHKSRIMQYDEVIGNAKALYHDFLVKQQDANRINAVLESIDASDMGGGKISVPGAKKKILPSASLMQPIARKSRRA